MWIPLPDSRTSLWCPSSRCPFHQPPEDRCQLLPICPSCPSSSWLGREWHWTARQETSSLRHSHCGSRTPWPTRRDIPKPQHRTSSHCAAKCPCQDQWCRRHLSTQGHVRQKKRHSWWASRQHPSCWCIPGSLSNWMSYRCPSIGSPVNPEECRSAIWGLLQYQNPLGTSPSRSRHRWQHSQSSHKTRESASERFHQDWLCDPGLWTAMSLLLESCLARHADWWTSLSIPQVPKKVFLKFC